MEAWSASAAPSMSKSRLRHVVGVDDGLVRTGQGGDVVDRLGQFLTGGAAEGDHDIAAEAAHPSDLGGDLRAEGAVVDFVGRVAAPGGLIVRVGRDEGEGEILDARGLCRADEVVGGIEGHVHVRGEHLTWPGRNNRVGDGHGNGGVGGAAVAVADGIGERIAAGEARSPGCRSGCRCCSR